MSSDVRKAPSRSVPSHDQMGLNGRNGRSLVSSSPPPSGTGNRDGNAHAYSDLDPLTIPNVMGGGTRYYPIAPLPARHPDSVKIMTTRSAVLPMINQTLIENPHGIDMVTTTASTTGFAPMSPLTDNASFPGDFDPSFDDVEYPPGPGRKKRKTPAFQLSSGRHDGCAVYDGDVVDGTDRHSNLPPIMLEPPAPAGRRQHDGEEDGGEDRADADGGLRERYGRDQTVDDERAYTNTENPSAHDKASPTTASTSTTARWGQGRLLKSPATQLCEFRKLLFLRRKAALITLFLDATSAIKSYWKDEKSTSTANMSKNLLSKLPEVDSFEKLLPALEDVGVGGWPPDHAGWRAGEDATPSHKKYGAWKGKFAKRRRLKEGRKEIVRGGWAPEGSFEFERPSRGEFTFDAGRHRTDADTIKPEAWLGREPKRERHYKDWRLNFDTSCFRSNLLPQRVSPTVSGAGMAIHLQRLNVEQEGRRAGKLRRMRPCAQVKLTRRLSVQRARTEVILWRG